MTAGQRNCFLAIEECLDRYRMDDVLFALREHILLRSAQLQPGTPAQQACMEAYEQIDGLRQYLKDLP